ncbi:MAG: flagellar motor protein MotB [Ketobacter sp.]
MEFENDDRPIIVKRVRKVQGGHHGGAWKVAFADFATAMMAFFLLLWLLEAASPKEKIALSGYFSDPSAFTEGGSPYVIDLGGGLKDDQFSGENNVESPNSRIQDQGVMLDEETVQDLAAEIENLKFQELRQTLETRIENNPDLRKYKEQIIMDVTREGLQIQIVDAKARPMFDSGRDIIKPYMNSILKAVAETLTGVPNRLSISGHTDAMTFSGTWDYSNWELSADRANAARRSLQRYGIKEAKVAQVVGLSSSVPYDKGRPDNPINRRITILVMNDKSQAKLKAQQEGDVIPVPEQTVDKIESEADALKAFERLRKTMTRKQSADPGLLFPDSGSADPKATAQPKATTPQDDEVF